MMDIVCTIDDKFTQYCGVMLTSLLENNKESDISVHIVTDGLSESNKGKLSHIPSAYRQKIAFYQIDKGLFADFPIREGDHVSLAAYYRLILADVLPDDLDKVLYLDSDIIIRSSIKELWETDISEYALAAVEDKLSYYSCLSELLGFSAEYRYFNSGVLLINLSYWREMDFGKKALKFVNVNFDNIIYHDQDVLNAFFFNRWKSLYYRWNFMDFIATTYFREKFFLADYYCKTKNYPIIIHFSASLKPWHCGCINLYKSEYFKYLVLTEWKDVPSKWNLKQWMKIRLKRFLFVLGIYNNWCVKYYI